MLNMALLVTCILLLDQLGRIYSQTIDTNSSMLSNTSMPSNGTFPCTASDVSFHLTDRCDGIPRCPQLDDEFLCDVEELCPSDRTRCLNSDSECIPPRWICDDEVDCPNGSDESFCEPVNCSTSCVCTPIEVDCQQREGDSIDQREISPSIRFLIFRGISIGPSKYPESIPFNISRFSLLLELTIQGTGLASLRVEDFDDLFELMQLDLSGNQIVTLEPGIFGDLNNLHNLDLAANLISYLERGVFDGLSNLDTLDLSGNQISNLEAGFFDSLGNLQNLKLVSNPIQRIPTGIFNGLKRITDLELSPLPNLSTIEAGAFRGMDELNNLVLYGNGLTRIPSGIFSGVEDTLLYLHIFENNISVIDNDTFKGLTSLEHLDMANNLVKSLRKGVFADLIHVQWLSLSDNPLQEIEAGTFENMTNLRFLNLVNVNLENLQPDTFNGITSLEGLSTDDYRLCCLFDKAELCSVASSTSLDSCARLMPNNILRVALWIIGFGALIGNSLVIVIRCREDKASNRGTPQRFFISNLAVADFLMGVYMIIIASADVYFGDFYYLYAPKWRESHLCKFAGFLAVLSSESSVFMLTLITIDRFLCVVFPFGKLRFRSTSARISASVVWILTFILSVGPLILGSYISGFYGLSDVCVGLPLNVESTGTGTLVFSLEKRVYEYVSLQTGQRPSWIYSIVLFLGINLFLFVVIFISYVIIFVQVKRSSKGITAGGRPLELKREMKVAVRMAVVVGSDFCCWMPVIIMGILSQSGLVQLPVSLYAWSVVFILPINASLNPYLYTFIAFTEKKKRKLSKFVSSPTSRTAQSSLM